MKKGADRFDYLKHIPSRISSGFILAFGFIVLLSCNQNRVPQSTTEEDLEAREDSLELIHAYELQSRIKWSVTADVETQPISAESSEDAADDPAIWVHSEDASKSLIFGSNKRGGIAVYDLKGQEVDYYSVGNINNIDIIPAFDLNGEMQSILGCTNRTDQSINLFLINEKTGKLINIASNSFVVNSDLIDDIYGFCFAKDVQKDVHYAVINGKNGQLQQFELILEDSLIDLTLRRSMAFDSQTEGMVADNENGVLFVGEENRGIWKIPIDPEDAAAKSFLMGSDTLNQNIAYDIEGLTIYKEGDSGYLVASSQGNFSYALFERKEPHNYIQSFIIGGGDSIDGVEETDGIDIVAGAIGPQFPRGLMVAQDGFNYSGDSMLSQNFKYIDFGKVLDLLLSN